MEKTLQLKAEIRKQAGSKASAKVRKQGRIPAIVYGHKEEPVAISLDAHDFVEQLHHGHRLMDVQLDEKLQKVIVKDVQYDHLGKDVIHADLMRVDITETVTVTVPIELKGTAKGAEHEGVIEQHSNRLLVQCKATDIPEGIVISVKDLDVGDSLHARDITLPPEVKLVSDPEMLIVACSLVAAAKTTEEVEAEAPVAPEVLGEAERAKEEGQEKEESA
ncbi:MAG: 50S ribosomal protein L25 [Sedimentisphaerales bacterium]|nr:50S ribosomal protein L25 [Sedimentisphaerales bacterium]